MAYVDAPVKHETDPEQRVQARLPFMDPHELLEYLVATARVEIKLDEIRCLSRKIPFWVIIL